MMPPLSADEILECATSETLGIVLERVLRSLAEKTLTDVDGWIPLIGEESESLIGWFVPIGTAITASSHQSDFATD